MVGEAAQVRPVAGAEPGPAEGVVVAAVPQRPAVRPAVRHGRPRHRCARGADAADDLGVDQPVAVAQVQPGLVEQLVGGHPPARPRGRRRGPVHRRDGDGSLVGLRRVPGGRVVGRPERERPTEQRLRGLLEGRAGALPQQQVEGRPPRVAVREPPRRVDRWQGGGAGDEGLDRLAVVGQQVRRTRRLREDRPRRVVPLTLALRRAGGVQVDLAAPRGVEHRQRGERLGEGPGVEQRVRLHRPRVVDAVGAGAEDDAVRRRAAAPPARRAPRTS